MAFNEKEFADLIKSYNDHFGEVFPMFEYPRNEYTSSLIKKALELNKPIQELAPRNVDSDMIY